MSAYHYQLCGWHVRSDLELPELPVWSRGAADVEVSIEAASLPERLDTTAPGTPWLSLDANAAILLHVPGLVRILVQEGRLIRVQRLNPLDEGWRLFLLGSALAYLCLQRGVFPLHAACLRVGKRTLAFAGHSGAGKSTLAVALARCGHALVSDDLTVLQATEDGQHIRVLPAFPRLKLWRETLDALAISTSGLVPVRGGLDKYDLQPTGNFDTESSRMDAIVLLSEGPSLQLTRHAPAMALPLLHGHLARPRAAVQLGVQATTFAQAAAICRTVPIWTLQHPREFEALDATVELVEAELGV